MSWWCGGVTSWFSLLGAPSEQEAPPPERRTDALAGINTDFLSEIATMPGGKQAGQQAAAPKPEEVSECASDNPLIAASVFARGADGKKAWVLAHAEDLSQFSWYTLHSFSLFTLTFRSLITHYSAGGTGAKCESFWRLAAGRWRSM